MPQSTSYTACWQGGLQAATEHRFTHPCCVPQAGSSNSRHAGYCEVHLSCAQRLWTLAQKSRQMETLLQATCCRHACLQNNASGCRWTLSDRTSMLVSQQCVQNAGSGLASSRLQSQGVMVVWAQTSSAPATALRSQQQSPQTLVLGSALQTARLEEHCCSSA